MVAVLFMLFYLVQGHAGIENNFYMGVSAIFFAIWIILVNGIDSLEKLYFEVTRIFIFMFVFVFSFYYVLDYTVNGNEINRGVTVFATFGAILCVFYLISKVVDIFNFIKKIFIQIKKSLFNTENVATSKFKAAIENGTTFLVTIGAFAIAVKTLLDAVFQVVGYFD